MIRPALRGPVPLVVVVALLAAMLQPVSAAAAGAEAFVRKVGDDVVDVLRQTPAGSEQREKRLRHLFVSVFDAPTIAKFVMGRHWRRLTDEQRERYLKVFPGYVAAIYARQFSDYKGQTFHVVRYRSTDGQTVVSTEIRGGGLNQPINLEIRVRPTDGGFKIIDVKVEGISLLVTKRDEFNTFLARNDVATLIDRLAKIAKS